MQTENMKAEPTAFDIFHKDHALRILLDYSASTGKGWTAILKEILSVVKPGKNDVVPNRQDLEAWAGRRAVIGDHKFKWIYRFLTHSNTLKRPEFEHAVVLSSPLHHVLRVGRALANISVSVSNSNSHVADRNRRIVESLAKIQGIYAGNDEYGLEYWAFNRIEKEYFLVVQRFEISNLDGKIGRSWDMPREAGFMSLSTPSMCHMKDILTGEYRPYFFNLSFNPEEPHLVANRSIFSLIEAVTRNPEDKWLETSLNQMFFKCFKGLSLNTNPEIEELVEKFKWSVPL